MMQNVEVPTDSLITTVDFNLSIWLWIAVIELLIIVFLLWRLFKVKQKFKEPDLLKEKLRQAKGSNVDMNNLMNSINGSKDLYKELSRKCHPDRFVNSEKQIIAEEIFQEISNNKRDYKKLIELKQRATEELKINFK